MKEQNNGYGQKVKRRYLHIRTPCDYAKKYIDKRGTLKVALIKHWNKRHH